jgi:superfamily I DNA/RNA helicase
MTHYGGSAVHGMLLERMFDILDEDQVQQLMIRMIESSIKAKQQHIDMMQYKIETYKMARDMLQAEMKNK